MVLSKRVFALIAATRSVSSATASVEAPLTLERLRDAREVLALNSAPNKNAISRSMLSCFFDAIDEVKFDQRIRVVVIRSLVPGAFCVGADLKERAVMPLDQVPRHVNRSRRLLSELEALPQPVIAAVDGYALGGGLEMALACDLRVIAANALVGLTETRLAIIPGAGGTQRLTRLVGVAMAKELIFTGRMIDGVTAERIGLANRSVEQVESADAAYSSALHLADEILPRGPLAVQLAKTAISRGYDVDLKTGLKIEELCYAQTLSSKDRVEGLQAFREKRKPLYTGE